MSDSVDYTRRDQVLESVRKKRGYTLSYHQLFASLNPELLSRYDSFYEALTLLQGHLEPKEKELVWIAILAIADEEAGSIHLKRAEKVGITTDEIAVSLSIAQLVKGFRIWPFVQKNWKSDLPNLDEYATYDSIVDRVVGSSGLDPKLVELIFIGAATTNADAALLEHHFIRAETIGVPEEKIAEAMSFIIIPRGGNMLLDMANVLRDVVASKKVKPTTIFKIWET